MSIRCIRCGKRLTIEKGNNCSSCGYTYDLIVDKFLFSISKETGIELTQLKNGTNATRNYMSKQSGRIKRNYAEGKTLDKHIKIDETSPVFVIGIGGRGENAVTRLAGTDCEVPLLSALATNANNSLPQKIINLGDGFFESLKNLLVYKDYMKNKVVFIINGLGGKTGRQIPQIVDTLKSYGNTVISIVSTPFNFEAKQRHIEASMYKNVIKDKSDIMIAFDNNRLLDVMNRETSFPEALKQQDIVIKKIIDEVDNYCRHQQDITTECLRNIISQINVQPIEFDIM